MCIFRHSSPLIYDMCGVYDLKQLYFNPFRSLLQVWLRSFQLPYALTMQMGRKRTSGWLLLSCLSCRHLILHIPLIGFFGTSAWWMVSYFSQLVHLGHTINLSLVASLHLWVFVGLLVMNSIFGLCKHLSWSFKWEYRICVTAHLYNLTVCR